MTPYRYTTIEGTTYFHYKFSDLREFVKYAYEGTAGALLWKRSVAWTSYKLSGTLEKPHPVKRMKDLHTMHLKPNPIFDGKYCTNQELITPPKEDEIPLQNYRMIFIDLDDKST